MTFASGLVVALRMGETLRRAVPERAGCISSSELADRLRRGERIAIVDVRTPEEFTAGHVDGAINLSIDALPAEIDRLRSEGAVVTVCTQGGGRSERAAQLLRERGLGTVWALDGGFLAWRERSMQAGVRAMKFLFILNHAPYGSEHTYNALRLAGSLSKRDGVELKVFLIGDAVAGAHHGQKVPPGYYNVQTMLGSLAHRERAIGVCGSCIDARGITDAELVEGSHRSSMDELTAWTLEADKVITF